MAFDPNRRVSVEIRDLDRARLWYNVKLWAICTAVFALPLAIILWCVWEFF